MRSNGLANQQVEVFGQRSGPQHGEVVDFMVKIWEYR